MSTNIGRIGFLGCGYMGRAILQGFLKRSEKSILAKCHYDVSVTNIKSAQKLQSQLLAFKDRVTISHNENLKTAKTSDVVLLCFPPDRVESVLSTPGMGSALEGKLVISLLAGVARATMEDLLTNSYPSNRNVANNPAQIVRVIPSLGALAFESATLIAADEPAASSDLMDLTKILFGHIGEAYVVPGDQLDPVMAMGTVCHALMAIAFDALVDGSAVAGIPRENALKVIGQCFRGYSTLIAQGEEPDALKRSLMIPKGFTARSILNLERRSVRPALSDAVVDIVAATQTKD